MSAGMLMYISMTGKAEKAFLRAHDQFENDSLILFHLFEKVTSLIILIF